MVHSIVNQSIIFHIHLFYCAALLLTASSEPFAFPKCRFPGLVGSVSRIRSRNIWQINIALNRMLVPAKHRVDSLLKLDRIRFVDTASVHPKVLQAVTLGLFTTELYFAIASIALARTVYQILESGLLRPPSVRKYSILWLSLSKNSVRLKSPSLSYCSKRIIRLSSKIAAGRVLKSY